MNDAGRKSRLIRQVQELVILVVSAQRKNPDYSIGRVSKIRIFGLNAVPLLIAILQEKKGKKIYSLYRLVFKTLFPFPLLHDNQKIGGDINFYGLGLHLLIFSLSELLLFPANYLFPLQKIFLNRRISGISTVCSFFALQINIYAASKY